MELNGKTVIFLGDSITEGAMASREENIYHRVFAHITGCKAINCGISGTRIAKQQKPSAEPSFDKDFVMRAQTLPRGDFVFVFGGTNDFGHGDAPFGEVGDKDNTTYCGACRTLIDYLVLKYGKGNVAVILPLHRIGEDGEYGDGSKTELSRPLADYVSVMRETAQDMGIRVIDFWEDEDLNPNEGNNGEKYFYDGLHPNDAGHKLLGEKLATKVEEI